MIQNYTAYVSGGSDYVQIFDQVNMRAPMDTFEMSSYRTRLLRDHLTSTCVSISENHQKNQKSLKVLPSRDYFFKRHFFVHVAGKRVSCSAVNGITVFIHPSCVDHANCTKVLPCVTFNEYQMAGLIVCKVRCQIYESWAYVLLDLTEYEISSEVGARGEFCEIWFSNVW